MNRGPLGRGELRRLLEDHSLSPSRALGQNFVVDHNTLQRIVRLAGVERGDRVLEIGAGLGSLTLALCDAGADVTAIEVDRGIVPLLRELVGDRARVVEADALRVDLASLLGPPPRPPAPTRCVANLPYNVATPLVLRVLSEVPEIGHLFVMVQREVGERLAARPGDKSYGAASVRVAYFATARVVGRVSPEVFYPRPHVESALVAIERRAAPAVPDDEASYEEIDRLLRAGFGGRRKMLRRSLAGIASPEVFERAGVEPTARAESLDVVAWGKLAKWSRLCSPMPS